MRVLAIDTSNEICSVAIIEDGKLIKEKHSDGKEQHSVNLMPMIKEILNSSNLTLNDIELLACGIGPGSFTGVRIGIATVKAFADAKGIPVVGVNSLEAQGYNLLLKNGKVNCKIVSMIDARNDNAYAAVYREHDGNFSIYKNPEAMRITEVFDYINLDEQVYIVGDVANEKIESILSDGKEKSGCKLAGQNAVEYIDLHQPMAEAIGIAALDKYKKGLYGGSDSIAPMYLQKPQAERQKDGDYIRPKIGEADENDIAEVKSNYSMFPNIWDATAFETDAKSSQYLVAKNEDEVVGFIGIKIVVDEIEIMNIVTREDKRNQGIASDLLSYVIRNYDVKKINLEVNEHNKVAKDLYLKFGFNQVGVREKYYEDGGNAILMSLY